MNVQIVVFSVQISFLQLIVLCSILSTSSKLFTLCNSHVCGLNLLIAFQLLSYKMHLLTVSVTFFS